MDKLSLCTALEGIEAVFVITPDFLDEVTAMNNLAVLLKRQGKLEAAEATQQQLESDLATLRASQGEAAAALLTPAPRPRPRATPSPS